MRKIKKIIGLVLYHFIGKHLPSSTSFIKIGQKRLPSILWKTYS